MNIIQFLNGCKYFQTNKYGLYRFNKEHEVSIQSSSGVLTFTEDIQTLEIQTKENVLSHYERDGETVAIQEYQELKSLCDSNRNDIDYQIKWMRFSHGLKAIHKDVVCWISTSFIFNKIPHSEYPEIEALFTYSGGDINNNPTYAILKSHALVDLFKRILNDNGFKYRVNSYSSNPSEVAYTYSIDATFSYCKINGEYMDRYNLKQFESNYIAEYSACVKRLEEFKEVVAKIIHEVNLKESKRILTLAKATYYYKNLTTIKTDLNTYLNTKSPKNKIEPTIRKIEKLIVELDEYISYAEKTELDECADPEQPETD